MAAYLPARWDGALARLRDDLRPQITDYAVRLDRWHLKSIPYGSSLGYMEEKLALKL